MLEEKRNFTVTLFLEIEHNGTSTKLTLAENLLHLLQVFVLKRDLEQVISVVDWEYLYFALASQSVDLVAEEECQIHWLFYAFESA